MMVLVMVVVVVVMKGEFEGYKRGSLSLVTGPPSSPPA